MKHIFTSLSICIITVSLVACNNENESVENSSTVANETISKAALAENKVAGEPQKTQETSTPEVTKPEHDANSTAGEADVVDIAPAEEPKAEQAITEKPKVEPLNLNDFRSAIDEVVQDSFQEEVENTVEGEVSKKAGNK